MNLAPAAAGPFTPGGQQPQDVTRAQAVPDDRRVIAAIAERIHGRRLPRQHARRLAGAIQPVPAESPFLLEQLKLQATIVEAGSAPGLSDQAVESYIKV